MFNRKIATALAGLLAGAPAFAYESSYNLPVGASDISAKVYGLHMMMFWVCVAIAVAVFSVMIYSIWKFRKSSGAVADKKLLHSTQIEVIWTVIPVVILVATAIPAARTLIAMEDTRNSEMTVKITGYQWKWEYDYIGTGVSYYSSLAAASNFARQLRSGVDPRTVKDYLLDVDNPMVVPVDTKVRLLLTGNDVIHSWWVPDFAVKKDAIPGFINEAWFKANRTGRFTGQCAELCGRDHGFMPIVVEVLSKDAYAAWLRGKQDAAKAAPAAAPEASAAPAATSAPATAPAAGR
jgi:cytochrome c oxidase subunit II